MMMFTEWKWDQEMIDDEVYATVAYLPTQVGASKSHGYLMLFKATCCEYIIENSTQLN